MEWSPQDAMEAFLQTSHLRKIHKQASSQESTRPLFEPDCMEVISALAAGKQAKLMVDITTQGITPLTIALVVAAKQTGGIVLCIVPRHENTKKMIENQLKLYENTIDMKNVMKIVIIGDPCELIKQCKNIDFAIIDGKFEDHLRLFKCIDISSKGSVVVVNRNVCTRSFGEVVKGKRRIESVVRFPFGEGMEITRAGSFACRLRIRKSKRFYVVEEN